MKQFYSALVLALAPMTTCAVAAEIDTRHYIYIEAAASVEAKADTAVISMSISEKAEMSDAAIALTVERSAKVMAALEALGVPMEDIETQSFRFEPVYIIATDNDGKPVASWPDPDRDTLDGYRASNSLTVELRDFGKVGKLLSNAATIGVEIHSVRFDCSRRDEFGLQADRKAAESAMAKARLYADALGVRLGGLLAAREGTGYSADTMEYPAQYGEDAADLMVEPGTPVPIAPPTISFGGSISTKWEVLPLQ